MSVWRVRGAVRLQSKPQPATGLRAPWARSAELELAAIDSMERSEVGPHNARITMSSWIPSWTNTPKREPSSAHSDWVLVTVEADGIRIVWFAQYRFIDGTWWDPEGRSVVGVTAWRELPAPFDEPMPQRWSAASGDERLSRVR
jgi:hypothetical protein